jgi:hypothetical protein
MCHAVCVVDVVAGGSSEVHAAACEYELYVSLQMKCGTTRIVHVM